MIQSRIFTAKYRDASRRVVEDSTGCRDETAPRRVLADLQRRVELVKAGVVTSAESATGEHQSRPLAEHFAAFIEHQRAKAVHPRRVKDTESQLNRVAGDCGFDRLADLNAERLERWLVERRETGMSAATRNEYRAAIVGFANWCVRSGRLLSNPLVHVARADTKLDPRRKRRAMTEAELVRLLEVAHRRPLAELGRRTIATDPKPGSARRRGVRVSVFGNREGCLSGVTVEPRGLIPISPTNEPRARHNVGYRRLQPGGHDEYQVGQAERRLTRFLSANRFGRRRLTLDVRRQNHC